jgi:hypothetical protein
MKLSYMERKELADRLRHSYWGAEFGTLRDFNASTAKNKEEWMRQARVAEDFFDKLQKEKTPCAS